MISIVHHDKIKCDEKIDDIEEHRTKIEEQKSERKAITNPWQFRWYDQC